MNFWLAANRAGQWVNKVFSRALQFGSMPHVQPTLHEAMRRILIDAPGRTSTLQFLSDENARRDLYRRGDGLHPFPQQFRRRALRYSKL